MYGYFYKPPDLYLALIGSLLQHKHNLNENIVFRIEILSVEKSFSNPANISIKQKYQLVEDEKAIAEVQELSVDEMIEARINKYSKMGVYDDVEVVEEEKS